VPPADSARAFEWGTKGVLAFDWEQVEVVDRLRRRIGDIANDYQVRAFVGGRLQDEGATRDPEGEQTARVQDTSRVTDGWQEIAMPDGTEADNLEVRTFGPVVFYEIEILTPDGTVVRPAGWAVVKESQR
jgi:hypothetical protein